MQSLSLPSVPVVVGRKRTEAAQWFLLNSNYKPTHWILDDGFQHRKIKRNIDIVLIDSRRKPNIKLLPAGFYREPLSSLKRAHHVLLTYSQTSKYQEEWKLELQKRKLSFFEILESSTLWPSFEKKKLTKDLFPVFLVTGIAQPYDLKKALIKMGVEIEGHLFLGDHKKINEKEIQKRYPKAKSIVTTKKDYCRDQGVFQKNSRPFFVTDTKINLSPTIVETLDKKDSNI